MEQDKLSEQTNGQSKAVAQMEPMDIDVLRRFHSLVAEDQATVLKVIDALATARKQES